MGRYFSLVIIFGILVIGGFWLLGKKGDESDRLAVDESISSARRTFAAAARSAINEEDEGDYVRGIQAAIKAFDGEMKKKVYKERPEWRDPDAYKKDVEHRFKEGKLKEVQHKSMLEGYELVRDAYDVLMSANWRPQLTAKGKADTRMDIYTMKRMKDDEGNPILEGKFFFWGVEDSTRMGWGQLSIRYWKTEMQEVKEGRKKVEKEVEKVLGRADGDSQPHFLIQNPHKYIADFPSYVSIGRIWLPVMPREAENVDIAYGYTPKKGGMAPSVLLEWKKIKIPPSWQLRSGESWDADEIEATEDEIHGREPGEGEEEEEAK